MSEPFGERLTRLRTDRGLSIGEVARRLGVTHSIITRAERNEQHIRAWRVPVLARVLGVSTDYLLTGREAAPTAALHAAIRRGESREMLLAMVDRHGG